MSFLPEAGKIFITTPSQSCMKSLITNCGCACRIGILPGECAKY